MGVSESNTCWKKEIFIEGTDIPSSLFRSVGQTMSGAKSSFITECHEVAVATLWNSLGIENFAGGVGGSRHRFQRLWQ